MDQNEVRIVTLEPIRVASALGFGTQPEDEALGKMQAWAGSRGYLEGSGRRRMFGFNNPSPSDGRPNYGYEVWVLVDERVQSDADVEVKEVPGGLYAVLRCPVMADPGTEIPEAWKRLALWREGSRYRQGTHQWLEEHLPQDAVPGALFTLDLYYPLAE